MARKPGKNSSASASSASRSKTTQRGATSRPPVAPVPAPQSQPGKPTSAAPRPHTNPAKPGAKVEGKPGVNLRPSTSGPAGEPTREAVAEAAYFLWIKRGGSDVQNWLEAEATLRANAMQAV